MPYCYRYSLFGIGDIQPSGRPFTPFLYLISLFYNVAEILLLIKGINKSMALVEKESVMGHDLATISLGTQKSSGFQIKL